MNKTFSTMPGSKQVGNYIISKNLGEGTFGKVKLGIHMQTQQKVAIKILQKSKISDVADVQRVTREINILKQVRHPNIIQLYQIIETPKQLFLVMQYVSEGELFEHIVKKKRLKENEACEFFQQIVSGVQYLHELGVVHRDLKPENLLIDFNKRLKLVDFGLSNTYKNRDLLKTACGSPCYAAPEMIAGKKYQGLNADIWSCGVILYAMVCGYLPFQDPNTSALYKKIISGEFSIPKFVSSSAKDLIRGILTTDPNRRYSLKAIKNHEWFKHSTNILFYNFQKPPIGIKPSVNMIPVDQKIIQIMEDYDCSSPEQIKRYISNNRHNHTVTVYYLLMKKNLRQGIYSPADNCSPNFDDSILEPKQFQIPSALPNKNKIEEPKTIQSVQLNSRSVGSGYGNRNASTGSRAINRIYLKDFAQSSTKRKQDSVQLKIDIDNLPIVENGSSKISQRRRRLQIKQKQQKQDELNSTNFYDIDEHFNKFRHTIYSTYRPQQKQSVTTRSPPISYRTSLDRYGQNKTRDRERYVSLDSSIEKPEISVEKQVMNKTFMGRIPKNSTPKWEDESQRIRSILNKTITGHGTRKKKTKNSII